MLTILLLFLLIFAVVGAIPWSGPFPYNRGASGLVGVVLLVLLLLLLTGNLEHVRLVR